MFSFRQENGTLKENPPDTKKRKGTGQFTKRQKSEQSPTTQRRPAFNQHAQNRILQQNQNNVQGKYENHIRSHSNY